MPNAIRLSELPDYKEVNPSATPANAQVAGVADINGEVQNVAVNPKVITDVVTPHFSDENVHLSADDHENLTRLIGLMAGLDPDLSLNPMPQSYLGYGGLSNYFMAYYFSKNILPDTKVAPGKVYVSRVPWARWNATTNRWDNNESQVADAVFQALYEENKDPDKKLLTRKFMDNEGLEHTCSTNKTEARDDYNGKEWVFFWERGNYMRDDYGVKHLTSIRGQILQGRSFSEAKNTGSFGPAFWYFCKTESYKYGVDANGDELWLTHDRKETGIPLFQLWGISDSSWDDLPQVKRDELMAHGIYREDFSIWPECLVYDPESGTLQQRPYWIHSAYCGGYEVGSDGKAHIVSKRNKHLYTNLSYHHANATYGAAVNGVYPVIGGGGSCVNGFGMLFDIVKNATKDSQSIHMGMCDNSNNAVVAAYSTSTPDYIFPISSQGAFEVGCTARLWQTNADSKQTQAPVTPANQYGRIISIESRTFDDANGVSRTSLCLVFDPESVQPFVVRTTIAEAKAISDVGQYACCYATQGIAMSGETDWVIGKHDGAVTSLTSARHPYRVQGTEYMPGAWMIGLDTVCCLGNGTQEVLMNGEVLIPTSSQNVYLVAPPAVKRRSDGNLASFMSAGYVAVGVGTNTQGYIMNVQLSPAWGVAYPLAAGGSGASSSTGHADSFWTSGAHSSQFLSCGPLNDWVNAGSASLGAGVSLSNSDWNRAVWD